MIEPDFLGQGHTQGKAKAYGLMSHACAIIDKGLQNNHEGKHNKQKDEKRQLVACSMVYLPRLKGPGAKVCRASTRRQNTGMP